MWDQKAARIPPTFKNRCSMPTSHINQNWATPTQMPSAVGAASRVLVPQYPYSGHPLNYSPSLAMATVWTSICLLNTKCTCCTHKEKLRSGPPIHMEFIHFWAGKTELM